ncbi:unnamed protein product [Rhodiola kirilowii]
MERYFSKRPKVSIGSSSSVVQPQTSNADILTTNVELEANLNDEEVEIIETDIVADPGLRKPIESYESNIRDRIRREYVAKGPCHPKDIIFLERSMEKIIEPLEMLGLKNLSGWSIVSKTMQHFAFGAFFSRRSFTTRAMKHLHQMGLVIGKKRKRSLENMLARLAAHITKPELSLKISKIKGSVWVMLSSVLT